MMQNPAAGRQAGQQQGDAPARRPGRASLITTANLVDPDGFYESLIALHQHLDDAASAELNAKLVLILANHIGDADVIADAFDLAARNLRPA